MKNYVMYKHNTVLNTLDYRYMTDYLAKTQKAEINHLKRYINKLGHRLVIIDIGIGNARVPLELSKDKKIWRKINDYIGVENSKHEITLAEKIILKNNLTDRVKIYHTDARYINKQSRLISKNKKVDLVICTYFTAGNFKPDSILLMTNRYGRIIKYPLISLHPNKIFSRIFKSSYKLLKSGGYLILGSVYIDNSHTREKQEEFYEKCGMRIITSRQDSFTATKEGFWSQRFTKKLLYDYLSWIPKSRIKFIALDNYHFARMVVVQKN